jgi:hypothetical protein
MLLFKRIFSLLSGFNKKKMLIGLPLNGFHELTDCPRTLDRSFLTWTVYEERGPVESGDDDGIHSHYVLMGG